MATDLTIQRNFKKEQRYWSVGQTIRTDIHITPKEGIYAWFAYYTNGKFRNNVVATAKSSTTNPQQVAYLNSAKMRIKQVSIGWKKYLRGSSQEEKHFNYYIFAGFGLELGRIINIHSVIIDTSLYTLPVLGGQANFKRLTIDPGLGIEHYLGGDISMYVEARVWIPTTDYPSTFIFVNEDAPWVGMINIGFRVIF